MPPGLFLLQNNLSFLGLLLIGTIVLSISLSKKMMFNKKRSRTYPLQEEILSTNKDEVSSTYGSDPKEVHYNKEVSSLKIMDVNSLKLDTKSLLISNNIKTVGDLKYASLDFLLDFSTGVSEEYLQIFQECKAFIKSLDYKTGRSILDI